MASRRSKRKQEELIVPTVAVPDTVASLAVSTNNLIEADHTVLVVPPPPPITDDVEITSIVTKRLSSDNVEDVTEAMESLNTFVYSMPNKNADENRKTAVRRGALLAVVQAMRRHASSHKIQNLGILVLSEISCCELDNFRQDIIAIGGLKACLEAMKRYDNNSKLQASGCHLIGNLWASVDVRKMVVDDGGLKAVVKAMEENEVFHAILPQQGSL